MECVLYIVAVLALLINSSLAGELTFELPDNERQCFFETIEKGLKCTLEFQVITGGNYDVDMELTGPNGQILYKDVKKQYDSFTWTTDLKGVYKFCFSNEFSTFSHKVVYFDFQMGDDKPIIPDADAHATAMTMMEATSENIHQSMSGVSELQTFYRLREMRGRMFAEDLNERVMFWSIGQSCLVLLIGIGQVIVLRSFFTDKKSLSGTPITS